MNLFCKQAQRIAKAADAILPTEAAARRLDALNKRLDAIAKEGEGAGPASGPTADSVHVPTTQPDAKPAKHKHRKTNKAR